MRDYQVPDNALKGFSMGGYILRIYRRYDNTSIGYLSRIATIPANHSQYFSPDFFSVFQRPDQINANVFFLITSTYGKNENTIFGIKITAF
jgi:hypothetical protein